MTATIEKVSTYKLLYVLNEHVQADLIIMKEFDNTTILHLLYAATSF